MDIPALFSRHARTGAAHALCAGLAVLLVARDAGTVGRAAEAVQAGDRDADDDRYPQAVRVGDLVGRAVLRPDEDRGIVGRILAIVRLGDGSLAFVMKQGGLFGFGERTVSLPLDQLALLGQDTALPDYEPAKLSALPTFSLQGAQPLPADAVIKVGLAKPYH